MKTCSPSPTTIAAGRHRGIQRANARNASLQMASSDRMSIGSSDRQASGTASRLSRRRYDATTEPDRKSGFSLASAAKP